MYTDSALTMPEAPFALAPNTSFGERTVQDQKQTVFEFCAKVFEVTDRCCVAFAGDFIRAKEIITILRSHHSDEKDFQDTIKYLNNCLDMGGRRVELLIATNSKNDAQLYQWNTANQELRVVNEYCSIGSLPENYGESFAKYNETLINLNRFENDQVLSGMAAVLQSLGLKEVLLEDNVGGTITGVEVSQDGLKWLGDTIYMIFDNDSKFENFVSVVSCEGGFATHSTYLNGTSYFVNLKHKEDFESWVERWDEKISAHFEQMLACNWVFINRVKSVIIIIQSDNPVSKTSASNILIHEEHLEIHLDGNLQGILKDETENSVLFYKNEEAKSLLEDHYFSLQLKLATSTFLDEYYSTNTSSA